MSRIARPATIVAALSLALLTGVAFTPASATTHTHRAPDPYAPSTGSVHGALSGAAAANATRSTAPRFRELRAAMRSHRQLPADQLHEFWGPETQAGNGTGEMATQSVLPNLTTSGPGDVVYAPTMKPTDGSCIEVVTAYSNQGPQVWAWDWCGSDSPAKVVNIDSSFQSTYTTTVDGHPSYTIRDEQTDASSNTWTASLYNYQTSSWDTFFTSAGSDQSGLSQGWDIFEIYATQDPSTGNGYYCADTSGDAFDSSSIEIDNGGSWQPITADNSPLAPTDNPNPSDYECPSLSFQVPTPNSHWIVQNGS